MLGFTRSKNKVQAYNIIQIPTEQLELLGVSQINPYCTRRYDNEVYFTLVLICYESHKFDEREGLVLCDYFSPRICPKCKKVHLIPSKIRINCNRVYLKHEEEIAFDAYEENPPRSHTSSIVQAYCNSCSSCFEIKIKTKDSWVKEAKKLTQKELVVGWDEILLD